MAEKCIYIKLERKFAYCEYSSMACQPKMFSRLKECHLIRSGEVYIAENKEDQRARKAFTKLTDKKGKV